MTQDRTISEMFREPVAERILERHISDALQSEFAVKQFAEKWLRRMHERTYSSRLKEDVEKLMPEFMTPEETDKP